MGDTFLSDDDFEILCSFCYDTAKFDFAVMKKFFQRFATVVFLFITITPAIPVHAQQFSLVPVTSKGYDECKSDMAAFEASNDQASLLKPGESRDNTLGCAIKTGRITFSMIPYFISYLTNFLLGLSGLICVLFIVIGGYHYVVGGLTEEKETGKNTIKHALMGMGIALLSWTIVSVLINAVTG